LTVEPFPWHAAFPVLWGQLPLREVKLEALAGPSPLLPTVNNMARGKNLFNQRGRKEKPLEFAQKKHFFTPLIRKTAAESSF